MNPTLLKALVALLPAGILLVGSLLRHRMSRDGRSYPYLRSTAYVSLDALGLGA
jgi:hypothetical protein